MGGHGGLNILPQKRWNVYNYENREKVRRDEEAAAREEQLKREQSRKRDAEFRLERLRAARGSAPTTQAAEAASENPNSSHINLFEGIKIFDMGGDGDREAGDKTDGSKKKNKKMKKEETTARVVTAEDEKYRLGYGVAGKGVKLPWYLERPSNGASEETGGDDSDGRGRIGKESGGKKKSLEELREERLKRERREKERERTLILEKSRRVGGVSKGRGFSRRG